MEGVLIGGSVRGGRLSGRGARLLIQRWSIVAGQSRHVGRMESWWHWGIFQDLRRTCTLLHTDDITVTDSNRWCSFECLLCESVQNQAFYRTGIFGNFFFGGGGIFCFQNGNSRWPWYGLLSLKCMELWMYALRLLTYSLNRQMTKWEYLFVTWIFAMLCKQLKLDSTCVVC